jgi:hypothetical protein
MLQQPWACYWQKKAYNTCGRADGNRKQRGFRALTAKTVRRLSDKEELP